MTDQASSAAASQTKLKDELPIDRRMSLDDVIVEELGLRDFCKSEGIEIAGFDDRSQNEAPPLSGKLAAYLFNERKLTALCLSGGGIRSATFCLGVLQALAQRGDLAKFDYLSTVSGGGYIGSWLTGWIWRLERAVVVEQALAEARELIGENTPAEERESILANAREKAIKNLQISPPAELRERALDVLQERLWSRSGHSEGSCAVAGQAGEKDDQSHEAQELANLRDFANYLTPRTGLLSWDTWTSIAIVVRNMLVNWLLLLPVFLLFVSFPKIVAVLFELLKAGTAPDGAGTSVPLLQSLAQWTLFLVAVACYMRSEHVVDKELLTLQAHKRDEANRAADGGKPYYGLKLGEYLSRALLPSYLGAFLVSVALAPGSRNLPPWAFAAFAAIGALAWFLPFSVASRAPGAQAPATLRTAGESLLLGPTQKAKLVEWLGRGRDRIRRSMRVLSPADPKWLTLAGACAKDLVGVFSLPNTEWKVLGRARLIAGAVFGFLLCLGFYYLRDFVGEDGDKRAAIAFGVSICILAHLSAGVIFSALVSRLARFDDIHEWTARAAAWSVMGAIVWTAYAGLILWNPIAEFSLGERTNLTLVVGGLFVGLVAAAFGRSPKTSPGHGASPKESSRFDGTRIAVAGGILFCVALILALSWLFDHVVLSGAPPHGLIQRLPDTVGLLRNFVAATLVLAGLLWVAFFGARSSATSRWPRLADFLSAAVSWINVNKFSLHGYYRNRLIRAYLGASNRERRPNAMTGFDQSDNIDMCDLRAGKLEHVVNVALNLVHGKRLAWQERKASSFSVSRGGVGCFELGYRTPKKYGNKISLGTAMAISGAAVSPSMGYHSSPILAFVMTLFNMRLGWWLGNPAREAWEDAGPKNALLTILYELFGLTDAEKDYVYLSDGGHFENLGVYEMLMRRCRTIVAIDAGCDPGMRFEDLGNLVRKARIDLGVEISFARRDEAAQKYAGAGMTRLGLTNRPQGILSCPYCAVGEIRYPGIDERGALIYIKAAIHGDEPADIWGYAVSHPDFPHETTADQFFSESQFESYRRLGQHIGLTVFGSLAESSNHAMALEERARAHMA